MSETDYLNQIHQLVELQKVDDEIHAIRQGLETAPRDIEELRSRFDALDDARNVALDKMSHLQEQKKRLSLEIDDDSAKLKKSKNKMMQVGNAREYNAMIREMDNMERSNRTREEERLTLLEALEQHSEKLKGIEDSHAAMKADLDAKSAALDSTLAEARDRLAVMANKRRHFCEGIPRPIFQRYEFIRSRLEHPVIVPVDDGVCSGCNIAVPPQTYIELQIGQEILSCPNCQRLIYWDQHFEDPDAPARRSAEGRNEKKRRGRPDRDDAEEASRTDDDEPDINEDASPDEDGDMDDDSEI